MMWTDQNTRDLKRWLEKFDRKLNTIMDALTAIIKQETETMATLADLQAQVAAVGDAEDAAVALITGLAKQIQDLINSGASPEQFQALVDQLKQHTDPLAAAVTANTPAAP